MRKSNLLDLLWAEVEMAGTLLDFYAHMQTKDFGDAMQAQFEYLYWLDQVNELMKEHCLEWWELRDLAERGLT